MSRNRFRSVVVGCFVVFSVGMMRVEAVEPTNSDSVNRMQATALLQRYCFDCHARETAGERLALDDAPATAPSIELKAKWLKAWKMVRDEFMPPAESDRPTAEERRVLAAWIAHEKLGVDPDHPDPGRVTIRRLNRLEYEYSIEDLFGTSFQAEQEFSSDVALAGNAQLRLRDRLPPDETAFGFDNIGDFLTLPPALLERYFEIAEFIVRQVVVVDGPRSPQRMLNADGFAKQKTDDAKRFVLEAEVDAPVDGVYRIDVQFTIGGWQDYGGAFDFSASVDENELVRKRLDVGGYKAHLSSVTTNLKAGRHQLLLRTEAKNAGANGKWSKLELRPTARIVGPLDSRYAEYPEPHRRLFYDGPAPLESAARAAYAREILRRFATRAFRRPVEAETLDGLVALAMKHKQFESGMAQSLTAILTSSQFLFRAESQPQADDPAVVHPLDEYSLASRLSYLLWLSVPDDELMRLADNSELRRNLREQVSRMLADSKSERFFEDLPGQWLRTRNVLMTSISTKEAGALASVRASMKRETEMLFEHLVRQDRDLIELVTADYTFLDKKLADYYGIGGVPDEGFHRVSLGANSRRGGGILTHGSFLVGTSNPNRTSPVKRGLFVLEGLLGVEPPPPPPNVPALDDVNLGDTSQKTGRELLALHRADKSCASCHAHFDPIGIALENYNLVGRFRDEENGRPIDAAEDTLDGTMLRGIADLQRHFVQRKDRFYRGVTEKLMTYALGRGLDAADSPTIDRITADLVADGGKFSTLLHGVVESTAFQQRRGDDGNAKSSLRSSTPSPPPPEKRRPPKKPMPE